MALVLSQARARPPRTTATWRRQLAMEMRTERTKSRARDSPRRQVQRGRKGSRLGWASGRSRESSSRSRSCRSNSSARCVRGGRAPLTLPRPSPAVALRQVTSERVRPRQVFSHVGPNTLLTLLLVNKRFHAYLTAKSSERIWKAARRRVNLPDLEGLTGTEYAELMFGKTCHGRHGEKVGKDLPRFEPAQEPSASAAATPRSSASPGSPRTHRMSPLVCTLSLRTACCKPTVRRMLRRSVLHHRWEAPPTDCHCRRRNEDLELIRR